MATDAVRDAADNMMGSNSNSPENPDIRTSSHDLLAAQELQHRNQPPRMRPSSTSYAWMATDSAFSRNVDRWISGDLASPLRTGLQPNRFATMQRSTPAPTHSTDPTGSWVLAAMVLPLLSLGGSRSWRCTPSTVLNTMELFLSQISGYCSRVRSHIRHMTRDQGATDVFATLMDVVLVIYAIGFLILSMYQASMFQQV